MWNMQNDLQGGNAEGGSNNNNNIQNILRIQQQQQQQQQQGMQQGNMNIESLLQQQMGFQQQYQPGSSSAGMGMRNTLAELQQRMVEQQQQMPKMQVKCDSCDVMLEVVVPRHHPPSMIVRCGNCSILLEVMLKPQEGGNPLLAGGGGGHAQASLANGAGAFGLQQQNFGNNDNMSYLQQNKGLQLGFNRQDMSSGLPFNQYNMLHHQHINFDSMRSPSTNIQDEMRRGQNLSMLYNLTGGLQAKRGMGRFDMEMEGGPRKKSRKRDPNKPKKLSKYNQFVSMEVKRLKAGPEKLSYKEMFKLAAQAWRTSPMNPNSPNYQKDYDGTTDDGQKYVSLAIDTSEDSLQLTFKYLDSVDSSAANLATSSSPLKKEDPPAKTEELVEAKKEDGIVKTEDPGTKDISVNNKE